ncbi:hypothetical protein Golax_025445, partial [Gossypium laxum]|nr:hypothetical protein [Gossypium laxum]
MAILQSLQNEDVEWRASWMITDKILHPCGDFDWVPLLGIWGAIRYAHLLVLSKYRSRQFIPATQSRNSVIELKVSLNKIDELKGKIEEFKTALQNCELRVGLLETNIEHWKEQLQRSQSQIKDRDHTMGEVVTQVREVTDHLQTLAVQADMLNFKYKSESDQGRELAWLLRKV